MAGADTIKHGREFSRTFAGPGWQPETDQGVQDLCAVQKTTWGKLGYKPTH